MANKKVNIFFMAIIFSFLTVNLNQISFVSAQEKKVDMVKVKRYIEEVGIIFKENPEPFGWDSATDNKYLNLVKEINLNDDEVIEVARAVSKDVNFKKYEKYPYMKEEEINIDEFSKYSFYSITIINLIERWKKITPSDEVIMNKIMPLIKTNDDLKATWIGIMNELTISDEIRPKIMDTLIEIFSDKSNSEDVRFVAAYVWSRRERRGIRKYEGFDVLLKDEDVFEKIGDSLWSLTDIDNPIQKIYEKMFDILENREKYSARIINGLIDFFRRDSFRFLGDQEDQRKNRLKKILKEIIEKEKNAPYIEKFKDMLQYIEKKEKEGAYK